MPMLPIMSISALVPGIGAAPAGAALLSACIAKTKTAVKIGIHLNIHGIRRDGPSKLSKRSPVGFLAVPAGLHWGISAMLRSDCQG